MMEQRRAGKLVALCERHIASSVALFLPNSWQGAIQVCGNERQTRAWAITELCRTIGAERRLIGSR